MSTEDKRMGIVVSGSTNKGVEVRLDADTSVEDMVVGRYVTIEGRKRRFFGMITEVILGVTDLSLTQTPPDTHDSFISEVLCGTGTFGTLEVMPYLTIGGDTLSITDGPQPVKTIPSHYSTVQLAQDSDIELVFGKEDKERFYIGNPLDMETKLCINLPELVKRSNGIFGKSGTGKTFLTRILLIGMLQKSASVNLVFDMHSEYGWAGTSEKTREVKALKQLFPSKVAVFTLDEENSRKRGVSTDHVVRIGYNEIEPEDMSLLRETLNLTEPAVEAIYQMRRKFGSEWFLKTTQMSDSEGTKELLNSLNIHESTFQNLQRGLNMIKRLPFMQERTEQKTVNRIIEDLSRGLNVVLEFGRYTDITAYILVANLLTRRIYSHYRDKTEKSLSGLSEPPIPLVITIEEAHKFLNREIANKTIFGTIAREMRKYNVTLLVIDQRPSGIDEEIMSQLGTKITCLLDNERDMDSVLSGVSGKSELKSVLAKLSAKQQALIFGHSVPMPVAFRPREYGSAGSYKEFGAKADDFEQAQQDIEDLW
ncbi:MAG: ATP-binding protein [Dehalococcoidales bacterium]